MDELRECSQIRPLLPELATGAATGHDRARVLRHCAGCAACRHDLAEYARVADEVLLLAPVHEPPAGFESAVVARMRSTTPVKGRLRQRYGHLPAHLVRAAGRLGA